MTEPSAERGGWHDLIVDRRGVARFQGQLIPCAIGNGGIVNAKCEGDGGTPVGVWRMEQVYVRADRIASLRTALPLTATGPQDGWCDDPAEPAYNQPVTLPVKFSHERMRRGDGLYDMVVVLDHNRNPPEPGKGSAIFIHCWRRVRYPTEGCIAFRPGDLRKILADWNPLLSKVIVK